MRQLSRDQLITTLRYQLGRLGPSARKKLVSRDQAVRMRWSEIVAETIADQALHRFEILTDAPLPPGEQPGITVNGRLE